MAGRARHPVLSRERRQGPNFHGCSRKRGSGTAIRKHKNESEKTGEQKEPRPRCPLFYLFITPNEHTASSAGQIENLFVEQIPDRDGREEARANLPLQATEGIRLRLEIEVRL
jgi:hypothetical protein